MSGNILIIDDEIKLLKLLGMILSQENFNVKEASTARSAMTMLEQYEFDVVLSDVRLPDPYHAGCARPVGADRGLAPGVPGAEDRGRRLPGLAGRAGGGQGFGLFAGHDQACAAQLRQELGDRHRHQPAQPEDHPVLHDLPAAVRLRA